MMATETKVGYMATVNVPGYLPMDDDPPVFDSAREAWAYLADEWYRSTEYLPEDAEPTAEEEDRATHFYSEAGPDAEGTIYTSTPGYAGDHDLGLAYSVTAVPVQECSSCGRLEQTEDTTPDARWLCVECAR